MSRPSVDGSSRWIPAAAARSADAIGIGRLAGVQSAARGPWPASAVSTSAAIAIRLHMRPTILCGSSRPRGAGDLARGVLPRRSGEAVARMRARTAEIEPFDRRGVVGPAQRRPHGEQLVERELAMMNMAAGEAVDLFEVEWCDDLPLLDQRGDARRVRLERAQDDVRQDAALGPTSPTAACRGRTACAPTSRACR